MKPHKNYSAPSVTAQPDDDTALNTPALRMMLVFLVDVARNTMCIADPAISLAHDPATGYCLFLRQKQGDLGQNLPFIGAETAFFVEQLVLATENLAKSDNPAADLLKIDTEYANITFPHPQTLLHLLYALSQTMHQHWDKSLDSFVDINSTAIDPDDLDYQAEALEHQPDLLQNMRNTGPYIDRLALLTDTFRSHSYWMMRGHPRPCFTLNEIAETLEGTAPALNLH